MSHSPTLSEEYKTQKPGQIKQNQSDKDRIHNHQEQHTCEDGSSIAEQYL